MPFAIVKILLPTTLAFLLGIALTPHLVRFMHRHRLWKRKPRKESDGITSSTFEQINNAQEEVSTPRVGGILVWLSVSLTIAIVWGISKIVPSDIGAKLDFYSRSQTLVPFASFILGSLLGLVDDMIEIHGRKKSTTYDREIRFRYIKIALIVILGAFIGYWFYHKLGMTTLTIPFSTKLLSLGWLFVPGFIIVLVATFSTGVIDGLDGLAGGVLAIIFSAYTIIAYGQNQIDIAALCAVVTGALLAFLWFNIPPARFYLGETGMMGLLVLLAVVAFLTDTVLILPIIALPLVLSSLSSLLQIISYKYFGKRRIFRVAPLHHHFQALGWSREKVVMRYWIFGTVSAFVGVIITFISK